MIHHAMRGIAALGLLIGLSTVTPIQVQASDKFTDNVSGTAVNFLALGITGYFFIDHYGNNGTPNSRKTTATVPPSHADRHGRYWVMPLVYDSPRDALIFDSRLNGGVFRPFRQRFPFSERSHC